MHLPSLLPTRSETPSACSCKLIAQLPFPFPFFFSFSTTRARDGDRQQSQTRWAAATAHSIISANKENLEAIVAAFRQKQSVVGCIAALEVSAAKRAAAS